jgi:hypothetical protein
MRVGYKKAWGVALMVMAGVLMMLLVLSGAFARQDMSLFGPGLAAIASLITGIGYLTRTYFEVAADRVILFALIGPLRREYSYSSRADLRIEGGKLFVAGKKVPISRGQADAEGWERFAASLTQPPT